MYEPKDAADLLAHYTRIRQRTRPPPSSPPPPELSVPFIIRCAGTLFKVPADDSPHGILGVSRLQELVTIRYVTVYTARQLLPHVTLNRLAACFHRDHTTIMYALRMASEYVILDPLFRRSVDRLKGEVKRALEIRTAFGPMKTLVHIPKE